MNTKTYRITLPESSEALGKWLEQNNAQINICCMVGKYAISITKNYPGGHSEAANTSVTKASVVIVNAYGDEFTATLADALRLAKEATL